MTARSLCGAAAAAVTAVAIGLMACSYQDRDPPARVSQGSAADRNNDCLLCHQSFLSEPLSRTHAEQGVGCTDCHGPSLGHRMDEQSHTPPDVAFQSREVDTFCLTCHQRHEIKVADLMARGVNARTAGSEPGVRRCTVCHGQHRMRHGEAPSE